MSGKFHFDEVRVTMAEHLKYPFRIFVSYAHADKPLVEKIVQQLDALGYVPLWDTYINPGRPFTQEIKELIARSHLFLPIITEQSNQRPWVHQETGFAIALNIPVLPICIGQTPSEMIAEVQAVTVQEDLSDFALQLTKINLMELVVPKPAKPFGMVAIADTTEARIRHLVQYADWVSELNVPGPVRIQSRLTSFSIPDADVDDPIWAQREGAAPRSEELRRLYREERRCLESHARRAGCQLLIDPSAKLEQGDTAQKVRLGELLKFLESMSPEMVEVAVSPRAKDTTLIMVGDYFFAETMAWRQASGYVHTVFNSHPPTVLQRIQQFDRLFDEIQAQKPMSLEDVIQFIKEILARE